MFPDNKAWLKGKGLLPTEPLGEFARWTCTSIAGAIATADNVPKIAGMAPFTLTIRRG
jgi:hypothetical protein